MLSYNVSIHLDKEIESEWIRWMHDVHIPHVLATGCFIDFTFFKLLEPEPADGSTYIIQYRCAEMSDYLNYVDRHSDTLRKEVLDRYSGKFTVFRTLMEEVSY